MNIILLIKYVIKNNLTISLLILLSFLLRIYNLNIGSPILYVSNDEAIYHLSALNMLAEKTPFSLGNYGPLGSYVQLPFIILSFLVLLMLGKVGSIEDMQFLIVTQEGYLLFVPRLISALFGIGSVYLCYLLAKEIFKSKHIAYFSALLFAVSFNLVHISHLARSWSPAIFFILLTCILTLRKFIFLAFISSAISFGFHQISGISIFLIFLIKFFSNKYSMRIFLAKEFFYGIFVWFISVFFLIFLSVGTNFITLSNPKSSMAPVKISQNLDNIEEFIKHIFYIQNYIDVIKELFLSDGVIVIFSIIYMVKNFLRNGLIRAITIFILVNLFLFIYFYLSYMRYFLSAFVFLPIFAGKTLAFLYQKNKICKIIAVFIIFVASFNSIYWNYLLFNEPTFKQVRKWLDKNINPEISIASTDRRNFDYVPNNSAAEPIRKYKKNYYKKAADLLRNRYSDNVRNVIYLNEFGYNLKITNLQQALKLYNIRYVVDYYWQDSERITNYSKTDNPNIIFTQVAHFSPTGNIIFKKEIPSILFDSGLIFRQDFIYPLFVVDRAGPYFDVLKMN